MGVFVIYGIIVLTFVNWSDGFFLSTNELPCAYEDSVEINGTHLPDGSILHDGTIYKKDQYYTVYYRMVNSQKRIRTDAYLRACPCMMNKPCLRLCCELGSFVNTSALKRGTIPQDIPCYQHEAAKNYQSEVFDRNSQQSQMQNLDNIFSYAVQLKPTKFYKLFKYEYKISNVIQTIDFPPCVWATGQ